MAAECAFCGSSDSKITKEHVIPDWISRLFRSDAVGSAELLRRDGSQIRYPIVPFQQTVRAVCKECNETWMSDLEATVKRPLGPMIAHGQAARLAPQAQHDIATWAAKTALMLEYLHPSDRTIPESECHRFYAAKKPPAGYLVWLAHRTVYPQDGKGRKMLLNSMGQTVPHIHVSPSLADELKAMWYTPGRAVFRVTYAIGRVVFQILGHNLPGHLRADYGPIEVSHCIWPVQDDVTWPPPVAVEEIGGVIGLHKAFEQPPPKTSS